MVKKRSTLAPFSFILFGASGHLARIKIFPALYILALKGYLPKDFTIVGFGRTPLRTKEFQHIVKESIEADFASVNQDVLSDLLAHCHYHTGNYTEQKDFISLSKTLADLESGWKNATRVAYLSVPPEVFGDISKNLCAGNVHKKDIPFRCIVEKPVGNDLQTFEKIEQSLKGCFTEEELYLLDHYLGKEAVRNIYYLRFANPMLERLFKNTIIHHVEITAFETDGLEGRAGYFEHTGTFRDMFQSHLLQICALLTMRLEGEQAIETSRKHAIEELYIPPYSSLDDIVFQGQYTKGEMSKKSVPGYTEEDGVDSQSRTNTFAALKLQSRTSRWQGVPFYLRSGKRLSKKETRISIQFQEPREVGKGGTPNRLDIILQGEAGMRIHLQTKIGGTEPAFRPLILSDPLVCVGECLPEHGLLLLEAVQGDRNWYVDFDEVRMSWRLIDPLQTYLEKKDTPLHLYPAGSDGPTEMHPWIEGDGISWF